LYGISIHRRQQHELLLQKSGWLLAAAAVYRILIINIHIYSETKGNTAESLIPSICLLCYMFRHIPLDFGINKR
jgi:hypothetical protein